MLAHGRYVFPYVCLTVWCVVLLIFTRIYSALLSVYYDSYYSRLQCCVLYCVLLVFFQSIA